MPAAALERRGSGVPGPHVSTQGIKLSALEWARLRSLGRCSSNLLTHLASAGCYPPARQEGSQRLSSPENTPLLGDCSSREGR